MVEESLAPVAPPLAFEPGATGESVRPPPASTSETALRDSEHEPVKESGKKSKKDKDKKRKQGELKPWERYRALTDASKTAQDLLEFGDRKVRFGLVVIGAINIVIFGAASRSQTLTSIPEAWRPWILLYMAIYAVVLVYGVRHAISALRPRIQPTPGSTQKTDGLHFYEDIVRQRYPDFEKAWLDIPIEDLSSLLTRQIYSLAQISRSKFAALQRMYAAINLMIMMAGGMLFVGVFLLSSTGSDAAPSENASAAVRGAGPDFTSREYKLMLRPERFAEGSLRATDDSIKRAIVAYWSTLGAESLPAVRVRSSEIDQRVFRGPSRHRLVQFLDSKVTPSDTDCGGNPDQTFFYDCKGLVLRSRLAVKPFDPAVGFEIDDQVPLPLEITLKSRSAANLTAAMDLQISAVGQPGAPLIVESKIEKDMTVGRTTYGQSCTVEMKPPQARVLFSGLAPLGPGIAIPQDLSELLRLFSAPQLARSENRAIAAVKDYAAYEQVYKVPDAIEFPEGVVASMSMTLWYDMKKDLKVVEASWRIERKRRDLATAFSPLVVGSAEQFLDHVVGLSQRRGWFSGEAQKKKTQALSAVSE
jgi:hypothetical protein